MKKFYTMLSVKSITIVTLILFQTCFYSYGQIAKNSTYLGGQFNFGSANQTYDNSQPEYKNNSGGVGLTLGKFISENTVGGLYGNYSHSSYQHQWNGADYNGSSKYDAFSVGIFYRKYKMLAKDFYFFAEIGLGYFYSKQTGIDSAQANSKSNLSQGGILYLTPGLSYKIWKSLYLDLSIPSVFNAQYSSATNDFDVPSSKISQFFVGSSLSSGSLSSLGVGFHFIF